MNYDAIIVGAGAAGLWAAGTAARRGRRILVLEKNSKSGVKILMSGGTRCNITHHCDERKIADAFGKPGKALLGPLSHMPPARVVDIFEQLGVETKIEETGKIFPVSNRAIDVRDALLKRIAAAGGTILNNVAVTDIDRKEQSFFVHTDHQSFSADHVLITTGGLSFAGCGTTGDGYAWVQKFGHTIEPTRPALTPIVSSTNWVHELSGITLPDVVVQSRETESLKKDRKIERSRSRGGFLWTHFGFSGPTAMNVSRCFSGKSEFKNVSVQLDLLPDIPEDECQRLLDRQPSKTISSVLQTHLPKRISTMIFRLGNIDPDTKIAELNKAAKAFVLESLKRWTVPVHGTRGYPKAEVTAGGVKLKEVDFQTMESRLCDGLFLAGEILDLDGPIGGFNFQSAWSTGHVAGMHL